MSKLWFGSFTLHSFYSGMHHCTSIRYNLSVHKYKPWRSNSPKNALAIIWHPKSSSNHLGLRVMHESKGRLRYNPNAATREIKPRNYPRIKWVDNFSVVRVRSWLVHLVSCISPDLVLIVFLLNPYPSSWLVDAIHKMTIHWISALLPSNHATVSAGSQRDNRVSIWSCLLSDTIGLHPRLCLGRFLSITVRHHAITNKTAVSDSSAISTKLATFDNPTQGNESLARISLVWDSLGLLQGRSARSCYQRFNRDQSVTITNYRWRFWKWSHQTSIHIISELCREYLEMPFSRLIEISFAQIWSVPIISGRICAYAL